MADPHTLTTDDYTYLQGLLISPDPATRADGLQLAKKLSPAEQQAFFDFQKQATRGRDETSQRLDRAVATGVPGIGTLTPEELLAGGAIVRGIGRVALSPEIATTAGRVLAAARAAGGVGWGVAKYEGTKLVLEKVGVPSDIAGMLAFGVFGRPGPATATAETGELARPPADAPHLDRSVPVPASVLTAEERAQRIAYGTGTPPPKPVKPPIAARTPAPEPVAPPEAAPAAPAPPDVSPGPSAAPGPPGAPAPATPAGFGWSPQRIQNELGLAARRMKVSLTAPQYQEAADLVRQGQTPTAAVAQVNRGSGASPVAPGAGPTTPPPGPKPKVPAAVMAEYARLRRLGKSHAEAVDILEFQQALIRRMGTPSTEAVREAVAERNASGRWPE